MSAERGGGECWAVQTETGRGPVPGQVTPIVWYGMVWRVWGCTDRGWEGSSTWSGKK